jgi:hypothetical protein
MCEGYQAALLTAEKRRNCEKKAQELRKISRLCLTTYSSAPFEALILIRRSARRKIRESQNKSDEMNTSALEHRAWQRMKFGELK